MDRDSSCLNYHLGLKPEVYFKPQEVWEIRGAEYVVLRTKVHASHV